jgi:hypothetical protein
MRLNNDWLNIIKAPFGQIDSFKIYAGALPTAIGLVTGGQTLLADLTAEFTADANNTFAPVTDGVGTKMVWQGAAITGSVSAAGDMAFFTMKCSTGTTSFLVDGIVTATGGGGDVEFPGITVINGGQLAIDGISFVFNDVFNT